MDLPDVFARWSFSAFVASELMHVILVWRVFVVSARMVIIAGAVSKSMSESRSCAISEILMPLEQAIRITVVIFGMLGTCDPKTSV